ncbi:D-alanyl-D-alanine endopeptidase [Trinickia dabaoshanensis]|uniref:D-alanyl-D-alanine endopeptidase n=1 Tax=Trinickia dabaoshanensis TaxID=564714 RepID=A0A2N7W380_9BURK|nr:D-alanyl-D-alanine endopeptidase [Trinickia dabaoshanensis]PMS23850.1 D-alanyl-D-alanine endopeptidase [Trinickia dabaoshanensis]
MKIALFSSLNVLRGVALGTIVAGLAVATVATPIDAFAATDGARVSHHKKHAKKEAKSAAATEVRAKDSRRVRYTLRGHSRHGVVHRVAFEPRSPTAGQPFGLQETPEGVALRSNVAFVVDQNTSEVLFDKNSTSVVPIASISKLMTAMVVLDSKEPLTEQIEVTDEDRDYIKHTTSRLRVGSVLTREDMLHIALMASENRAAAALSRYYPGGRPAFIAAMNAKAKALGMNDTHFESPTGLTSENVSTARDLVKMIDAAYQYPLIRKFSTDRSYDVYPGRGVLAYNSTNALVRNPTWDIGLQKTGFINEAGECLVMQATIHGRPMVMVLLDSTGKYSRFADATRLRKWLDDFGGQRITSADAGGRGT